MAKADAEILDTFNSYHREVGTQNVEVASNLTEAHIIKQALDQVSMQVLELAERLSDLRDLLKGLV